MCSNFNVIFVIFYDFLSFLISMWFSLCLYDFARLSYFNVIFVTSHMILLGFLISMWFLSLFFLHDFAKLSYFNVTFLDAFYDFTRRSYFNVIF